MTISSSLNAGVAGLAANATRLATISDNIANSATYGYKRAETDFHAMVTGSTRGTYTAGGVRTTTIRQIDDRGSIIASSSATDLAVRGAGMLPVTSANAIAGGGTLPFMMTTTGSFSPDENGYLRSSSGLVLMGWPAAPDGTIPLNARDTVAGLEPIRINANQMTGQPTTMLDLVVNLPATETVAGSTAAPHEMSVEYFDNLGLSESIGVTFTPSVPGAGASNEWTMVLTDSAQGGTVIGEYVLTFDDTRGAGGTLLSVTATSGGAYDPVAGTVAVEVDGGPIEITIGALGAPGGTTQLSDTFSPVDIGKNGSAAGTMTGVEIDANGYVHALFDTGATRTLYQIPLVDVPNPNGLQAMDGQTYAPTQASGSFFLWDAGDGPTGEVASYAQEESATDVAAELTGLITTQRAYSSNAKVIQTVDEMLQETTNMKR